MNLALSTYMRNKLNICANSKSLWTLPERRVTPWLRCRQEQEKLCASWLLFWHINKRTQQLVFFDVDGVLIGGTLGSLIYCTRTIPEMNQCMRELKRLMRYREKELASECKPILGFCMTSRKNLCINEEVSSLPSGESVDVFPNSLYCSYVGSMQEQNDDSELRQTI